MANGVMCVGTAKEKQSSNWANPLCGPGKAGNYDNSPIPDGPDPKSPIKILWSGLTEDEAFLKRRTEIHLHCLSGKRPLRPL